MELRIAMNHATVRQKWNLEEFIEGCARHGIHSVALWRDMVEAIGISGAKRLMSAHNMRAVGYNRIGPLVGATTIERKNNISDAKRVIDDAAELTTECVFIFPGGLIPGSKSVADANSQTMDALESLLPHAVGAGVQLAIEPLHPMIAADRSCICTMRHANDICDALGIGVGVVVDVYHVWWDPTLEQEILRAGKERLLGFHVSVWLVPTRNTLSDRGMMGDGVIDLQAIRGYMDTAGYAGVNEVELFSDRWWSEDPDAVIKTAIERCYSSGLVCK